jgi:predicted Zn-dependent protease
MNLERFMSTVYSEQIKKEYFETLNISLKDIDPSLNFVTIRDSYVKDAKPYKSGNELVDYMIHTLVFEKIFQNSFKYLENNHKQTILIFPVFHDIDSKNRLKDGLSDVYKDIINRKKGEFTRGLLGNSILYLPAFSDETETMDEYSERLSNYLSKWFNYINEQKPLPNEIRETHKIKFDTVCYSVETSGELFTDYYSKKLKQDKSKKMNELLVGFLEKLGLNPRSTVKDPLNQLTPDIVRRKYRDDGKTDLDNLEPVLEFLKVFLDVYKRSNDAAYLKSATASDDQNFLRIYYRINRTDDKDEYTFIKPGSSYVYLIKGKDPTGKSTVKIGYFNEKNKKRSQYLFREYKGLTAQYLKERFNPLEEKVIIEKDDIGEEYVVETTTISKTIYFRRVKPGKYNKEYDGKIELFLDLHIYEKYKWFDFKDMGGQFKSESNIRYYENVRFDKKSLILFLEEKKTYTKDTKLNQEFLKINQDNDLFLEYVEFIYANLGSNVYVGKGSLDSFKARNKKSILDILFQTNTLLYTTHAHSEKEKTDISKNYKMVLYNSYEPNDYDPIEKYFEKIIYEMKELKYCDKSTACGDFLKEIQQIRQKEQSKIEYAIVIVDVTKENIEVDADLKSKTYCKKLNRTLQRQLQPYMKELLPIIGGKRTYKRKRKKLFTRRRQYCH